MDYETYQASVPLLYTKTEYETDPTTGSIFRIQGGTLSYNVLHELGDPVLDGNGNQVYSHNAGDPILDADGNPQVLNPVQLDKEFDILLIDAKYYYASEEIFTSYRKEIRDTLTTWIVDDLQRVEDRLLEQTNIYFYPTTEIGTTKVIVANKEEVTINTEQPVAIDVYIKDIVYNDTDMRSMIETTIIQIVNKHLSNTIIDIKEINDEIGDTLVNVIESVDMKAIATYKYLVIKDTRYKLCIRKILELKQDGETYVVEDVDINYIKVL
jgi:hypothetical protein